MERRSCERYSTWFYDAITAADSCINSMDTVSCNGGPFERLDLESDQQFSNDADMTYLVYGFGTEGTPPGTNKSADDLNLRVGNCCRAARAPTNPMAPWS